MMSNVKVIIEIEWPRIFIDPILLLGSNTIETIFFVNSDFVEMFIHHITTILLMGLSWTCNLTRVGTLVLVIHDVADILLEVSKFK